MQLSIVCVFLSFQEKVKAGENESESVMDRSKGNSDYPLGYGI